MANFIGLAYAVVKQAGYDTSKMSATEVIDKYNEIQKKTGQKEATPKEYERLKNEGRKDKVSKKKHEEAIKKLESNEYEDGTYNLGSMKQVEYDDGYQVTFCQIGDDYTEDEYAELCNEFLDESTDEVVSAGKFGGTPEVSFHVKDRETAERLAKKYNQVSIWDWENYNQIGTGGTGRRE